MSTGTSGPSTRLNGHQDSSLFFHFSLDSGDVSGPVLSEHGYHLVKILSKQPERMMGYLETQDMIRNYLYQEKFSQRLSEYLARIAEKVYIKRAPQRGRF